MRRRKHSSLFTGKRSVPIKIAIGIVLLVLLIVIIVPSGASSSSNAEVNAIRKKGTLRVALSDDYNGFANESGEGLETEIATHIANAIFKDSDSKNRITYTRMNVAFMDTHFNDSSVDIALMQCPSDMYPSKYSYSKPYYTDSCLIIIKRDANPHSSLNGMTVGVIANSICEMRLNSYIEDSRESIKILKYSTYELMLYALQNQKTDACVMSGTMYRKYASGALRSHSTQLDGIPYSVVCSSENAGLMQTVGKVITELEKSGKLAELINKHIGA